MALITGSDSGIGRATAVRLAQAGMDIGITWHRDDAGARRTRYGRGAPGRMGSRACARRAGITVRPSSGPSPQSLVTTLATAVSMASLWALRPPPEQLEWHGRLAVLSEGSP